MLMEVLFTPEHCLADTYLPDNEQAHLPCLPRLDEQRKHSLLDHPVFVENNRGAPEYKALMISRGILEVCFETCLH